MPRKRWIEKNESQTYRLLYRPQDDPLLNDETAGERALYSISEIGSSSKPQQQSSQSTSNLKPGLRIADLEQDVDLDSIRENEGEAAEYGIYFDDTEYDYLQHLRDIGEGSGEAYFVDAAPVKVKGKGNEKGKAVRLEDALREMALEDESVAGGRSAFGGEGGFSTFSRATQDKSYQNQQEIPDEIAGFKPDMDPRLREVLEALEDDEYVDEADEEGIFDVLGRDGRNGELDLTEFELSRDDEDEGWESDATEKASQQVKQLEVPPLLPGNTQAVDGGELDASAAVAEDGDWLRDFAKYKRDAAKQPAPRNAQSSVGVSAIQDQAPTLYTLNGTPLRRKKRKGALTNPTSISMTSSSLARTDGQQLLDARFDQMEKMYSLEEADEFDDMDGQMSLQSGMTGASKMSKMSQLSTTSFADEGAVRQDFDSMMDGFLGDWNKANPGGKRRGAKGKRGKNGNEVYGLQQLEEVRRELGPARLLRRPEKT